MRYIHLCQIVYYVIRSTGNQYLYSFRDFENLYYSYVDSLLLSKNTAPKGSLFGKKATLINSPFKGRFPLIVHIFSIKAHSHTEVQNDRYSRKLRHISVLLYEIGRSDMTIRHEYLYAVLGII